MLVTAFKLKMAPTLTCVCKVAARAGPVCINCNRRYHPSCLQRVRNVFIVNDSNIICCGKDLTTECANNNGEEVHDLDGSFFDAEDDELQGKASTTIENRYLKIILRHKNYIIKQLQQQLKAAMESNQKMPSSVKIDSLPQKETLSAEPEHSTINAKNDNKKQQKHETSKKLIKVNERKVNKQQNNDYIETPSGRLPLHDDKATDNSRSPGEDNSNSTWTMVKRKKHPKQSNATTAVTGLKEISSITVAPKKAFLYVSRLSPGTKPESMVDLLKADFPEVQCEELESKFPQHYASFKIIIDLLNYERAMDPTIWPYGIYVTRFFQKKSQTNKTT
ncbi:hypothetical protein Zmor_003725 [Zophobas morio]|uniref:Uncharacterized protein n=2 Tax=Zophobas morio TaxID=2755281 RepID=A0AA38HM45_9CUCU|nr:hypothetical protein Zmor_003725 [Zophobas morio]